MACVGIKEWGIRSVSGLLEQSLRVQNGGNESVGGFLGGRFVLNKKNGEA